MNGTLDIIPIDPDTRVSVHMDHLTQAAAAYIEKRTGDRWQRVEHLLGIGHGRQDAVADLLLKCRDLARHLDAAIQNPPWISP